MAHEPTVERHRPVPVAIGPVERAEEPPPLHGLVEPVGVVEGVPCFVPQVHEDLALVLDVVDFLLELGQLRIRQVEGNADDGLAVRAAPLVGEIARRSEMPETLAGQLAVQDVHVPLDR